MYSYQKQRHAVWQKISSKSILLPLFILAVSLLSFVLPSSVEQATAATSSTLSFQGRLMTNSGTLVPDGSYNIEFKLYNASAIDGGESLVQGVCQTNPGPVADEDCLWVESRTGVNTVTVQNGYFSVNLGSVTAFPGSINWDQELWLGMNIGGIGAPIWDGEMTPRFKLTAVPYAFRAGALVDASGNAKTADDLAQLAPASVQTVNAAIAALRINQTGAGSLLQLQGNGTDVFTVDKNGNAVLGAGITLGNSSATTAGTIRWNGSAFQGYNGSSWTSLGSSAVMPFVSKTKTVTETQNNVVNPTAALQADDELSFSIGANETWNYRFELQMGVNATPDVKFSVTAPVGATCANSVTDEENAISVANLGCGVSSGIIAVITGTDVFVVSGSVTNGANAGTVTLNWAQNTANAANTTVIAGSFVEASRSVGGSSADVAFIQDGNSFGGLAVLGTNDANGLAFETNGVERLQIQSGGDIQAKDDLIANRTTTGVTGTTSGTGTNTATLTLAVDTFNVNDVVFIDNVGQDYYTRITVDPGTGSYTVSPNVTFANARTVTAYTIQNIGATSSDYTNQANRFFQGYFLGGVVIGAGSTTIGDGSIESTTTLNIQAGGGDVNIGGGLTVSGAITGDGSGLTSIDAANITGTLAAVDGSALTSLNASNISSGTLADGRLSSNVTLLGNSFNGASQLVQLDVSGNLPVLNGAAITNLSAGNLTGALAAIDGSALTSLNASNISSGTLADGRLSTNVTLLGNTFNGSNQLVRLDVSGNLPAINGAAITNISAANITGTLAALDGSALTSLNASNISSGTLADGRLSSNVTLLGNSFNGVSQLVQLDVSGNLPALNGAAITNLSAANLSGALAALDGSALTNLNGSNISSGTVADARLSANVTLLGNTFNGSSQLVRLDVSGNLPAINGASLTNLSAGNLSGALAALDGSALTSLNASNISSGTLADGRLSANVTLLGNTFNGNSQLVRLGASGELPALNGAGLTSLTAANLTGAIAALDGSALTSLNASNIASGTLADGRLSANVTLLGNTFNGTSQLVQLDVSGSLPILNGAALTSLSAGNLSGALPSISGANLTSLNASNISSGTLNDSRLSANVALLNGGQTFSALTAFGAGLSATGDINATGAVAGATVSGDGSALTSLNGSNISSGTVADARLSANVALLNGGQTFSSLTSFTNGVVLGQSTVTSAASVARAVSLPDEAGTICLSNKDTCGYIRLAAGTVQTDASTNSVISINKTNATGSLIDLQRSGGAVFTVANSGALQIQATGTAALDIRNVGGTSYFSVDTNTGNVRVGPSVADASGVLFTLDTKNTSGDPTGSEGSMYYNSVNGAFRCYQNARGWTDCLGAPKPNTRRATQFLANGTSTTITSDGGDIATVSGTGTAQAATTAIPPSVNYATAAGANSDSGISGNTNYNSSNNPSMQVNVRLVSTANTRNWVGFTNQTLATMNGAANPAGIYAAFRYDTSAADANWQCITKNGGAQTINNSGIAASTTNVELEIIMVNGTTVEFKINGVAVCNNVANLPAANTMMRYVTSRRNLAAGAQSIQVAWLYIDNN